MGLFRVPLQVPFSVLRVPVWGARRGVRVPLRI